MSDKLQLVVEIRRLAATWDASRLVARFVSVPNLHDKLKFIGHFQTETDPLPTEPPKRALNGFCQCSAAARSTQALNGSENPALMDDWFNLIAAGCELSAGALQDLRDVGFVVIPGPVAADGLAQLAEAYDSAVAGADADDLKIGSTTTRVSDFVNRGPAFDELYVYQPLLEACCRIIGQPFRLSTMHARTVRPRMQAQDLHVDFECDAEGWPMIGFILMVDEFRSDNGATGFVPGSHRWPVISDNLMNDRDVERQVLACGPAGSVIIYNGSIWHRHTANQSGQPRRSIQGAYIRREAPSGANLPARMRPETLARISPLAKYLLAI